MQIKTAMRYNLTPVRMTVIKKNKLQMLARMWRKGDPSALGCYWKCKLVQPLWKTVWIFIKKNNYDCAMPFLSIQPKKMKALIQKNMCSPMFTETLFTIAKIWKEPKCPSTDDG